MSKVLQMLEKSLDMHLSQLAMLDKAGKRIVALENRVRELEGSMANDSQKTRKS